MWIRTHADTRYYSIHAICYRNQGNTAAKYTTDTSRILAAVTITESILWSHVIIIQVHFGGFLANAQNLFQNNTTSFNNCYHPHHNIIIFSKASTCHECSQVIDNGYSNSLPIKVSDPSPVFQEKRTQFLCQFNDPCSLPHTWLPYRVKI